MKDKKPMGKDEYGEPMFPIDLKEAFTFLAIIAFALVGFVCFIRAIWKICVVIFLFAVAFMLPLQSVQGGIVADTLFAECRGESKAGQLAVASVIYNRAQLQHKTPEAVCLATKQFSAWNNGYVPVKARKDKERAILSRFEAIEEQIHHGTFKPTTTADHYYAFKQCKPSWEKTLTNKQQIGSHIFGNTK